MPGDIRRRDLLAAASSAGLVAGTGGALGEVGDATIQDDGTLLAFVTSEDTERCDYAFIAESEVTPVEEGYTSPSGGNVRATSNYHVTEEDGHWYASGHTAGGYGDAYEVDGDVLGDDGDILAVTHTCADGMWIEVDGDEVSESRLVGRGGVRDTADEEPAPEDSTPEDAGAEERQWADYCSDLDAQDALSEGTYRGTLSPRGSDALRFGINEREFVSVTARFEMHERVRLHTTSMSMATTSGGPVDNLDNVSVHGNDYYFSEQGVYEFRLYAEGGDPCVRISTTQGAGGWTLAFTEGSDEPPGL